MASADRARAAFWLMGAAVLLGLMLSLTSSAIDMALLDAGVEDPIDNHLMDGAYLIIIEVILKIIKIIKITRSDWLVY